MELSINNYIHFLNLEGSMWGFCSMSLMLVLLAQFKPFQVLALMCFFPTVLWSSSWKPFVTLYPVYPLLMFLFTKYIKDIANSLFQFRYGFAICLSILIVLWSFFSPVLYTVPSDKAISFSMNPNYQRGIITIFLLLFIPALIKEKSDIQQFFISTTYTFMTIHIFLVVASVVFLLSGHSLYDLHLMRLLNTPPVLWESGLFVLFLSYFLVNRNMNPALLIIFFILALFGLILGNSRTRFISTFLCVVYFVYPYVNRRILSWSSALVVLIMVSLVVLPGVEGYFGRLIDQRMEQTMGKSFSEMSHGRASAYEYALMRWNQNPILGVGSCYIIPKANLINKQTNVIRVHNYYLEVLAGPGLAGFLLLLGVLVISSFIILKIMFSGSGVVMDGRLLVALFLFGTINWMFKESWGITYSVIALLSAYDKSDFFSLYNPKSTDSVNMDSMGEISA